MPEKSVMNFPMQFSPYSNTRKKDSYVERRVNDLQDVGDDSNRPDIGGREDGIETQHFRC